ncbi:HAD family hydrolase [Maritimibacter sp. DP1N21-5]|uniref:sulfotransferase-like domain-containing protein n=1 Tax=Maritimibacter sp. DP1N21-5 TaxID=2836867 RepID=UPI001C4938D4|nr:HAD family hydrolase [Maritimibacter sp. DP1N21-5]MBV7411002.1 HAD family hydrolase [Maritimibacter sp. DP1N21-5]
MKIACWSGPRNISTAMMYAFANRADFGAVDEPFYAAYLARTGLAHPMRDEILASQSQDLAEVIRQLTGPDERVHVYHKHMAQHMLPEIPRDWFGGMRHLFLIRHPARVVDSFSAKYDAVGLGDIGFVQQAELFDQLVAEGHAPVVVDSLDVRAAPELMLRAICAALGLAWDPAMLSWPAGPKPVDGVWAAHWYGVVHASTGFAGPEGPRPHLEEWKAALAEEALPFYERLRDRRLVV